MLTVALVVQRRPCEKPHTLVLAAVLWQSPEPVRRTSRRRNPPSRAGTTDCAGALPPDRTPRGPAGSSASRTQQSSIYSSPARDKELPVTLRYGFVKSKLTSDPVLKPSRHHNEIQYHL